MVSAAILNSLSRKTQVVDRRLRQSFSIFVRLDMYYAIIPHIIHVTHV